MSREFSIISASAVVQIMWKNFYFQHSFALLPQFVCNIYTAVRELNIKIEFTFLFCWTCDGFSLKHLKSNEREKVEKETFFELNENEIEWKKKLCSFVRAFLSLSRLGLNAEKLNSFLLCFTWFFWTVDSTLKQKASKEQLYIKFISAFKVFHFCLSFGYFSLLFGTELFQKKVNVEKKTVLGLFIAKVQRMKFTTTLKWVFTE